MTKQTCGLLMLAVGACLMTGCMSMRTLQTKAYGPTQEEAQALAKAQLNEQTRELQDTAGTNGGTYRLVGKPSFSTKELPQPGGGVVYEVTAKEQASRTK